MDRDTITRSTAQALVAGGTLLTVAALLGPVTWRQGEAHGKPAFAVLLTIFLLGPALSALCAVTTRLRAPRPVAGVAGAGALVAAVAAALAAAPEATRDGLAPGGPLAAVAGVATAGGWLIAALTHRVQGRVAWGPLAGATVVVVLLGWLGPAGAAAIARADIDAREVPALPLDAAAARRDLTSAGGCRCRERRSTWPRAWCSCATGRASARSTRAPESRRGTTCAPGGRCSGSARRPAGASWSACGGRTGNSARSASTPRRVPAAGRRVIRTSTVDHRVVGSGDLVVLVPRAGSGGAVALSASTGRRQLDLEAGEPVVRHGDGCDVGPTGARRRGRDRVRLPGRSPRRRGVPRWTATCAGRGRRPRRRGRRGAPARHGTGWHRAGWLRAVARGHVRWIARQRRRRPGWCSGWQPGAPAASTRRAGGSRRRSAARRCTWAPAARSGSTWRWGASAGAPRCPEPPRRSPSPVPVAPASAWSCPTAAGRPGYCATTPEPAPWAPSARWTTRRPALWLGPGVLVLTDAKATLVGLG